jgi:hypothetical protein
MSVVSPIICRALIGLDPRRDIQVLTQCHVA